MALAAIVASLSVARQRNEERRPELEPAPGRVPAAPGPDLDLDAIRSAGL